MKCKYCGKSFASERTLAVHMCPKKQRFTEKDLTHVRLGLRAYQMFYELSTNATKIKTFEEFANSQYYTAFVKYGRKLAKEDLLHPEKYTEWCIKNSVKLKLWTSDSTYNRYLNQYVKKEPALKAIERTILTMTEWAKEHNTDLQNYFKDVTTPLAVFHIKAGKISPWLMFLTESGQGLWTKFNKEQIEMIKEIADPVFWRDLFRKNPEEVEAVQEISEKANI